MTEHAIAVAAKIIVRGGSVMEGPLAAVTSLAEHQQDHCKWLIDPKDLDAVKDRKVGRPRKARKTSTR